MVCTSFVKAIINVNVNCISGEVNVLYILRFVPAMTIFANLSLTLTLFITHLPLSSLSRIKVLHGVGANVILARVQLRPGNARVGRADERGKLQDCLQGVVGPAQGECGRSVVR